MIISRNSAGLCNRIKCWMSSLRIDEECYVDWPTSIFVRPRIRKFPKFEELFDNENILVDKANYKRKVVFDRPDHVLQSKYFNCKETKKVYKSAYFAVLPSDNIDRNFIKNQRSEKSIIDLQYQKTPENMIDIYRDLFKRIRFKKYITDSANEFFKKNVGDDKLLTVHIRSFPTSLNRQKMWYNIENYFTQIDKIKDQYDKIFIAADTFEVQDQFEKKFKDKVIYYPKKLNPMKQLGGVESQVEAIVDLLMLGKGSTMLATETSTFSEVAWWLAECKPDVIKIGNIIYE